jgi:hypothetical protein
VLAKVIADHEKRDPDQHGAENWVRYLLSLRERHDAAVREGKAIEQAMEEAGNDLGTAAQVLERMMADHERDALAGKYIAAELLPSFLPLKAAHDKIQRAAEEMLPAVSPYGEVHSERAISVWRERAEGFERKSKLLQRSLRDERASRAFERALMVSNDNSSSAAKMLEAQAQHLSNEMLDMDDKETDEAMPRLDALEDAHARMIREDQARQVFGDAMRDAGGEATTAAKILEKKIADLEQRIADSDDDDDVIEKSEPNLEALRAGHLKAVHAAASPPHKPLLSKT